MLLLLASLSPPWLLLLLLLLSMPSLLSLLDRPLESLSSEEVGLRDPPEPSSSSEPDVVFKSFEELLLLSFEPPFSSEDCFLPLLLLTSPAAMFAVVLVFAPAFFSPFASSFIFSISSCCCSLLKDLSSFTNCPRTLGRDSANF